MPKAKRNVDPFMNLLLPYLKSISDEVQRECEGRTSIDVPTVLTLPVHGQFTAFDCPPISTVSEVHDLAPTVSGLPEAAIDNVLSSYENSCSSSSTTPFSEVAVRPHALEFHRRLKFSPVKSRFAASSSVIPIKKRRLGLLNDIPEEDEHDFGRHYLTQLYNGTMKETTCPLCSATYKHKDKLIFHMRMHAGIRPYECDICHKGFTQARTYKDHMYNHNGLWNYQCERCNKTFLSSFAYKDHIAFHDITEVGEPCPVCGDMFYRINPLRKHLRLVHNMSMKRKINVLLPKKKSWSSSDDSADDEASKPLWKRRHIPMYLEKEDFLVKTPSKDKDKDDDVPLIILQRRLRKNRARRERTAKRRTINAAVEPPLEATQLNDSDGESKCNWEKLGESGLTRKHLTKGSPKKPAQKQQRSMKVAELGSEPAQGVDAVAEHEDTVDDFIGHKRRPAKPIAYELDSNDADSKTADVFSLCSIDADRAFADVGLDSMFALDMPLLQADSFVLQGSDSDPVPVTPEDLSADAQLHGTPNDDLIMNYDHMFNRASTVQAGAPSQSNTTITKNGKQAAFEVDRSLSSEELHWYLSGENGKVEQTDDVAQSLQANASAETASVKAARTEEHSSFSASLSTAITTQEQSSTRCDFVNSSSDDSAVMYDIAAMLKYIHGVCR